MSNKISFLIDALWYSEDDVNEMDTAYINELIKEYIECYEWYIQ